MRKIVIGDVHGCLVELKALISKLNIQEADEVVFVGDLLDKGPDSFGVWRYVQDRKNFNGARLHFCWGNHEDKHFRYATNPKNFTHAQNQKDIQSHFTETDHKFFEEFVLFHQDPQFNLLIIHAGILPSVPDLSYFPYVQIYDYYRSLSGKKRKNYLLSIRLRFVTKGMGYFISHGKEKPEDPFWAELYDGRFGTVIFGHQAFLDTKFFEHAIGIDTGCVYGNKLSAIVFDKNGRQPYLVSVPSREIYVKSHLSLKE